MSERESSSRASSRARRRRVAVGGGLILSALMVAFAIDQVAAPYPGLRGGAAGWWQAAEGAAVGFAVVGAWIVTSDRRTVIIGLAAAAGLVVAGFVWAGSFLGVVAGIFGWPVLAAVILRAVAAFLVGRGARERPARAMMDDPSWKDPVARSLLYRR